MSPLASPELARRVGIVRRKPRSRWLLTIVRFLVALYVLHIVSQAVEMVYRDAVYVLAEREGGAR